MISPGCMPSSPITDFTSSPFLSEHEDSSYFHQQFQQQLQQLQQQQQQQIQELQRHQHLQDSRMQQLPTNNHALPLDFPEPPQKKMRKAHHPHHHHRMESEDSEDSAEYVQSYQQYHERRLMGAQYQQPQQPEQAIVPKRSYSISVGFPYNNPGSYQGFPEQQEPRRCSLPANPSSATPWSPMSSSWSSFPAHSSSSPSTTPTMSACSSVSFGSLPDLTSSAPQYQMREHPRKRSFEELGGGRSSPSASVSPSPNTGPHGSSAAMSPPSQPLPSSSSQEPHFLTTLLLQRQQVRIESEATEDPFDSEKILRQSKQMRNKLRSILGKLKKTC